MSFGQSWEFSPNNQNDRPPNGDNTENDAGSGSGTGKRGNQQNTDMRQTRSRTGRNAFGGGGPPIQNGSTLWGSMPDRGNDNGHSDAVVDINSMHPAVNVHDPKDGDVSTGFGFGSSTGGSSASSSGLSTGASFGFGFGSSTGDSSASSSSSST
eukprot:763388-Hanusia_phi.AAC.1